MNDFKQSQYIETEDAPNKELTTFIQENDPLAKLLLDVENSSFYDQIHDGVMKEIENKQIRKVPWAYHPKLSLYRNVKNHSLSAISVFVFAFLTISGFNFLRHLPSQDKAQNLVKNIHQSEVLEQAALQIPRVSESLISYQSESDFFVDLADNSFDHLSVDDLNKKLSDNSKYNP